MKVVEKKRVTIVRRNVFMWEKGKRKRKKEKGVKRNHWGSGCGGWGSSYCSVSLGDADRFEFVGDWEEWREGGREDSKNVIFKFRLKQYWY